MSSSPYDQDVVSALPKPPVTHLDVDRPLTDAPDVASQPLLTQNNGGQGVADPNDQAQHVRAKHKSIVTHTQKRLSFLVIFAFVFAFTSTMHLSIIVLYSRELNKNTNEDYVLWIGLSICVSFILNGILSLFYDILGLYSKRFDILLIITIIINITIFIIEGETQSFALLAAMYDISAQPLNTALTGLIFYYLPKYNATKLLNSYFIPFYWIGTITGPITGGIIVNYTNSNDFSLLFFISALMWTLLFIIGLYYVSYLMPKIKRKQLTMEKYYYMRDEINITAVTTTTDVVGSDAINSLSLAIASPKHSQPIINDLVATTATATATVATTNTVTSFAKISNVHTRAPHTTTHTRHTTTVSTTAAGHTNPNTYEKSDSYDSGLESLHIDDIIGQEFQFPICMTKTLQLMTEIKASDNNYSYTNARTTRTTRVTGKKDGTAATDLIIRGSNSDMDDDYYYYDNSGYFFLDYRFMLSLAVIADGICFGAQSAIIAWYCLFFDKIINKYDINYHNDGNNSIIMVSTGHVSLVCLGSVVGSYCARILVAKQSEISQKRLRQRVVHAPTATSKQQAFVADPVHGTHSDSSSSDTGSNNGGSSGIEELDKSNKSKIRSEFMNVSNLGGSVDNIGVFGVGSVHVVSWVLMVMLCIVSSVDLVVIPLVDIPSTMEYYGLCFGLYVLLNGFVFGLGCNVFGWLIVQMKSKIKSSCDNNSSKSYKYDCLDNNDYNGNVICCNGVYSSIGSVGNHVKLLVRCLCQSGAVIVIGSVWNESPVDGLYVLWDVVGYGAVCALLLALFIVVIDAYLRK